VAGGQDSLKGKALRLAHIGYIGDFDVITGIAARDGASPLRRGHSFGRVGAAQAVIAESLPAPSP
jgi:aspartate aminotransferase-like enzyme